MFTGVDGTARHFVDFTEAEEDLVFRMHRLVGNRFPSDPYTAIHKYGMCFE